MQTLTFFQTRFLHPHPVSSFRSNRGLGNKEPIDGDAMFHAQVLRSVQANDPKRHGYASRLYVRNKIQDDKSPGNNDVPSPETSNEISNGEDEYWVRSSLPVKRFLIGGLIAFSIVIGGNLGGITSFILGLNYEVSRDIRADILFPIKGFKRCVEDNYLFEFIYPSSWMGDQRLLYRAVERAERERNLDPFPSKSQTKRIKKSSFDPVVAFGPPGTSGELNVSVVVAPALSNFKLETLGGPMEVGEKIINTIIAPPGSGKIGVLYHASTKVKEDVVYYTLDYTVQGANFFRHNISVYAICNGSLYSLNAQSPQSQWDDIKDELNVIVDSFLVKDQEAESYYNSKI